MTTTTPYQVQAQLMRALAHPVRLRILEVLSRQEACVCHLETLLKRPQPYVSKQLATLRDAGLLADRREGTLIFYRTADEHVAAWLSMGRALLRDSPVNPTPTPAASETLDNCPCPKCQRLSLDVA